MRSEARFYAGLAAVTLAGLGIVLNLAVWFGWHVVRLETGGTD
jgi:hypothetical protein